MGARAARPGFSAQAAHWQLKSKPCEPSDRREQRSGWFGPTRQGRKLRDGEVRDNDRRNEPERTIEEDDAARALGAGNGQISRGE